MFDEIIKESFVEREEKILSFWKLGDIFRKSIDNRKMAPFFSFYDGPPFATGLPHYGNLLAGTIKDVIPRYKTMKGYCVPRRFGWDCHGLPIENEIEKINGLSGAKSIEEFGILNFNEECRKIVLRYSEEWKKTVNRIGRWVDFDNVYRTMDISFMESVWWVFKQLYDKGLIYQGFKVMPFSSKMGTPLSNFEAGLNYKEVDDPSITLTLPLVDDPETSLLVWTTTPWTLISNLAATVGPDIEYVTVFDKKANTKFIIAKERLAVYYKNPDEYKVIRTCKGTDLDGIRYRPFFSYFENVSGAFRVILGDFVSTDDGTGIVHTAPAFGEDDFYACKNADIPIVCPVNNNGRFTDDIEEYAGVYVKDADKDIIKRLKDEGRVVQCGTIRHRYPYCWRSDVPLIYKAMTTWFVSVESIKENMIEVNNKTHWTPSHLKYGRFGKWLEGARDWAISRNRYWGTPIPLWQADDGTIEVMPDIQTLEKLSNRKIEDIHRQYIDDITFIKNGKTFRRIPEVFDCWFESGSMPYAQNHYPFENKELTEKTFPSDFIAEGIDQTRGWFYTLTVLSTALFNKPAFNNVIVNGIVLAEDGSKMSKHLCNYPPPELLLDKYGADAVRLYMLNSPAVRADDLRFKSKDVEVVLRQALIPLWNAYSFFITYARIYKWVPPETFEKPMASIDQWLLSILHKLINDVELGMDEYCLSDAVEPFVGFIEQMTNWYIRRSRRRFWEDKECRDRFEAFSTLYQVLINLSKIAAPFVPFISESIYLNLRDNNMPESVHLCDFPVYDKNIRNVPLENSMEAVQMVVGLGRGLRKEHKIKVRQPLSAVHIASNDDGLLDFLSSQQHLIEEELNVKNVIFHCEEDQFVQLKVKPNFRVLGKKVGKMMKQIHPIIASLDIKRINHLLGGNDINIEVDEHVITIMPEDVEIERKVRSGMIAVNSGKLTILLDTTLNDSLILEGIAREIINKLNTMRRDSNLDVTDRITVKMKTTDKVKHCLSIHGEYIAGETLSLDISFEECLGTQWDINGEITYIEIAKA